jgi:TRAP-type mannitol/chloroaromatic compound transport system permease small subunit
VKRPSRIYLRIILTIDRTTEWTGYAFALLVIPLVLANTIEVFSRYVLNAPTIWALETTVMSYGALFMLGCAYALQKGAHIRTDIFWERFSDRRKGIIDCVAYLVFFMPTMVILFYLSFDDFVYAWSIDERSNYTPWAPVIWPLRGVVPLTALLLLVQGVSEFLKSFWAARTGEVLAHHEKIEL